MDSCTKRAAPPASAASTRMRDPSRRSRSFSTQPFLVAADPPVGILVARFITTSCPATAEVTAVSSNRSSRAGVAPSRSSNAALRSVRAMPVTS